MAKFIKIHVEDDDLVSFNIDQIVAVMEEPEETTIYTSDGNSWYIDRQNERAKIAKLINENQYE